jgi:hypothetical protein
MSCGSLYSEDGFRRHLASCQMQTYAASNTAIKILSRPSEIWQTGPGLARLGKPRLDGLGAVLPSRRYVRGAAELLLG